MATFSVFNEFKHNLGLAVINLETDTFKVMLFDDAATDPVDTATDPRYHTSGNPDYSDGSFEVTAGGTYSAGGTVLAGPSWTESAGTVTFQTTDDTTVWAVNGANPTDARHAVVYDFTTSGEAVGWFDLGQVFNMSTGTLTLDWNAANGLFTLA